MEDKKDKRVLNIELSNDVKRVSITGKNDEEQVVMRQELSEDDLDQAVGGYPGNVIEDKFFNCISDRGGSTFCPKH